MSVKVDNNTLKLGGVCAIISGLSFVFVAVLAVQIGITGSPGIVNDIRLHAQQPGLFLVFHLAYATAALVSIGAVLGISSKVRALNEGWVRWASFLVIIAFGVIALNNFRIDHISLAQQYATADPTTQKAIEVAWTQENLDVLNWTLGVLGIWTIVVNFLAHRIRDWPRTLSGLGVLGGIFAIFIMIGTSANIPLLYTAGALLGGAVFLPIWFVWFGVRLVKETGIAYRQPITQQIGSGSTT